MSSQTIYPPPTTKKNTAAQKRPSSAAKKSPSSSTPVSDNGVAVLKPPSPSKLQEKTVKKLRLSKALTVPEGTTVSDACCRMAARRVNAVLLTDANSLLSGIVTDKDIASKVVAEELRPEQTVMSMIMTRNPVFVTSESLASDALHKMVQGKFRHLPVVENDEVIALLDITKCMYHAISKMEKIADQGNAIAAAVEGVERQWGNNFSAPNAFIETLRERLFKPPLSTVIGEHSKFATVSPLDSVCVAARKMQELRVNSVIIMTGKRILGILTSKDILMRVVAQNLSPVSTPVEKVMTLNPECAKLETSVLDALHIMHDGKFLHLPVINKDGDIAACIDVLQIIHAAISIVENSSGAANGVATSITQKFWDSALASDTSDDTETQSDLSALISEKVDSVKDGYPSLGLGNSFAFKFEDQKGQIHRFNSSSENLQEIEFAVCQRIGLSNAHRGCPPLLYVDDEGDRILLAADDDLICSINYAKSAGLKALRLHVDFTGFRQEEETEAQRGNPTSRATEQVYCNNNYYYGSAMLASVIVLTGISMLAFLRRSSQQ